MNSGPATLPPLRPSHVPRDEVHRLVDLIAAVARVCGVSFDHEASLHAAEQAHQDAPGDARLAWSVRLLRVAERSGLRVVVGKGRMEDVLAIVRQSAPIIVHTPTDDDPQRVRVLCDRLGGRLKVLADDGGTEEVPVTERELLEEICGSDPRRIVEYAVCESALPCQEAGGAPAEAPDHHPPALPPWRRLLALLRPERRDIRVVLAFALGVGGLTLAAPIAVQMLVNTVAFGGLLQPIVILSLVLLFALSFGAAMRAMQTFVVEIMQRRIFVRVLADLSYRLPRVRLDAFDRNHGPELVNRFFDVLTVQKVSAMILLDGVAIALQAIIGLVLLAFYHPLLLAFDIVLLASILFIVIVMGRGAVASSIRESLAKYAAAGWLEEIARHPMAFKTAAGPAFAASRADALAREYLAARAGHFRIVFSQVIGSLVLQAIASTILLGIGGFLVIKGQLTLGQLIAAELIVTAVVASVAKLGKHLEGFYDLLAAVDKLGHLLDLPLEKTSGELLPTPRGTAAAAGGAALRLVDLTFDYDGGPPVLDHLNVSVAAGERVALVGPSGCGKSSLVELLFGLRMPRSGRIELDGMDYRLARLEDIRSQVALVSGFELIDGTIMDNLRMGRAEVTYAAARETLAAVGLLDEVLAFPDGLATHLFTGGAPLSDGQSRRLMIARAIVGRPRLLVVDESIEGLDRDQRDKVLATLLDPTAPWTLILVTHTLDVLAQFPRVIDLGRLVKATGPAAPGSSSEASITKGR